MKHETYQEMENRLNRRNWILIGIAMLLPIVFILFFNYYLFYLV
jgi:hypothetical protein